MANVVEAEISFGETKIVIRGPQEFVQSEITRLASLAQSAQIARPAVDGPGSRSVDGTGGATNEREFVVLKQPKGHAETATVLGFWLVSQGATEFSEEDVRRAYVRAAVRPPKVVSQALRDAKRFLDSIEQGSKRGTYRLTPHGDRVVRFDLPRGQ